ncbi:MAG: alpha-ketoacid dehydrogenase subunit beta [Chloroflexi bacterium]|nr:alpha-ketoacid dehydrogenase subunit beta [Chloroflexota bacterium]
MPPSPTQPITLLQAIRDGLHEEMTRDENVIILGEDVGVKGGVFLATDGLFKDFGPDRVIDTPIAESSIVGVAIGASLVGMRPVAEIQFADYILPAIDQILNEAARFRYRCNGDWYCPLVIRAPYGAGVHGGLYHSQSVEKLFCSTPGLYVVIPATPYDAKGLLKTAIRTDDPVLFFEHKRAYRLIKGEVPAGDYTIPLGKADIKRAGQHLTVITYGLAVHDALQAAEQVAAEDLDVEVVDLRTLYPMDRETILNSAKKTGKVLVYHEDNKTGGVGGEIAAMIAEEAFEWLDGPILRLGAPDIPPTPFNETLERYYLPDVPRLITAIRRLATY